MFSSCVQAAMPSAAASRSSGSSRSSARTRSQWCEAAAKSVLPDPLGRAPVPARGGECLAGLLPVMREQRGALVEMLGVLLLDRARDRGVHLAAALLELAAERHLLRQRMLEGVLGHRVERLLVDELGAAQRGERRLQLVGR